MLRAFCRNRPASPKPFRQESPFLRFSALIDPNDDTLRAGWSAPREFRRSSIARSQSSYRKAVRIPPESLPSPGHHPSKIIFSRYLPEPKALAPSSTASLFGLLPYLALLSNQLRRLSRLASSRIAPSRPAGFPSVLDLSQLNISQVADANAPPFICILGFVFPKTLSARLGSLRKAERTPTRCHSSR
jgi:hypothetical protein